jgi:hypothetical protein
VKYQHLKLRLGEILGLLNGTSRRPIATLPPFRDVFGCPASSKMPNSSGAHQLAVALEHMPHGYTTALFVRRRRAGRFRMVLGEGTGERQSGKSLAQR